MINIAMKGERKESPHTHTHRPHRPANAKLALQVEHSCRPAAQALPSPLPGYIWVCRRHLPWNFRFMLLCLLPRIVQISTRCILYMYLVSDIQLLYSGHRQLEVERERSGRHGSRTVRPCSRTSYVSLLLVFSRACLLAGLAWLGSNTILYVLNKTPSTSTDA